MIALAIGCIIILALVIADRHEPVDYEADDERRHDLGLD